MRQNAWHEAIVAHLRAAGGALTVEQIWARMEAADFQHVSKKPRSTLGARVAELVQMKQLTRVGPATYQLELPPTSMTTEPQSQPEVSP